MRKLILLLALVCGAGWANEVPTDEDGFARFVANRVHQDLPDYAIAPAGRLSLEGNRADGESIGTLNLDRIYAYCARNASQCETAIAQYSKRISGLIKDRDRPIDRSMVRLAIRSATYAEQVSKQVVANGGAMYYRIVAPGIASIPVIDFSQSLRYVTNKDLAKLSLDEQQLFELGVANLRSTNKPLSEVTPIPGPKAFGVITHEDYASSRILMHDDWKSVSDQLRQSLVVLMPAPDVLLYGDGSTDIGVQALLTYASDVARKSDHPLPLLMLKWTERGWDVAN